MTDNFHLTNSVNNEDVHSSKRPNEVVNIYASAVMYGENENIGQQTTQIPEQHNDCCLFFADCIYWFVHCKCFSSSN